jgi:hypothetical protein
MAGKAAEYEERAVGTAPIPVRHVTASHDARQYPECTYASNLVHCVFSTAGRRDLIRDPERLRKYLTGIAKQSKSPCSRQEALQTTLTF